MDELRAEFNVELKKADLFWGYLRTILFYGMGARLLPVVIAVLLFIVFDAIRATVRGEGAGLLHIGFLGGMLALFAAVTAALYVVVGRLHHSLPSARAEYRVDDAKGIAVRSAGREERLPFSAFIGSVETKRAFYLYASRTAFRVIPRRSLGDGSEGALRQILTRRLPNTPEPPSSKWVTVLAFAGLALLVYLAGNR